MTIISGSDDQGERFEERTSGGDTAGAGEGGGKAASRGCSAQQISSLLFLSWLWELVAMQGCKLRLFTIQWTMFTLTNILSSLLFILIVFKVDRLRREGEEGRRRSSSQEAHYRTTEQVNFLMAMISTEYVFKLCLDAFTFEKQCEFEELTL